MSNHSAQAVLEKVLRLAMEEALTLQSQHVASDEDHGARIAYFNVLEFGKQQAALQGIQFDDAELAAFDSYSLMADHSA